MTRWRLVTTAELAGYWRYRVGDYRVRVEVKKDAMTVIAIGLGHRSEIFRAT